jgi:uncharacterized protein YceK
MRHVPALAILLCIAALSSGCGVIGSRMGSPAISYQGYGGTAAASGVRAGGGRVARADEPADPPVVAPGHVHRTTTLRADIAEGLPIWGRDRFSRVMCNREVRLVTPPGWPHFP